MNYLFLAISIFFIIIGILITKRIVNPLTIFNFIWGFIFWLYQFQLSYLQKKLSDETITLLIICVMSFSLSFIIGYFVTKNNKNSNFNSLEKIVEYNTIKKLFIFWVFVEVVETIYSGGVPILWKIMGISKTYFDYGMPTIHGLMNSLGLVITMLAFYKYLYDKKNNNVKDKRLIYIISFILIFYLLLITRQVIISAIIQMVCISLFFIKKIPWSKLIILGLVIIISFGIIGNVRTGYDGFLNVSLMKQNNIKPIFIGFYWVYMYLTMTLSNINNAVCLGVNGYGAFMIFKTYLPTVITNFLFANNTYVLPNFLVTQAFNVSGFFIEFYTGFGNLGVAIISSIYGILGGIILKKVLMRRIEKNILYYSIYIQIIALSFFYNHLLYLPSGFQLFIIFFLFRLKRGDNNEREISINYNSKL